MRERVLPFPALVKKSGVFLPPSVYLRQWLATPVCNHFKTHIMCFCNQCFPVLRVRWIDGGIHGLYGIMTASFAFIIHQANGCDGHEP